MEEINMTYIDLAFNVDVKDLETAAAIADMVSPYGFSVEDYSDFLNKAKDIPNELIDQDLFKKDRTRATIHLYMEEREDIFSITSRLKDLFLRNNIEYSFLKSTLKENDYALSWKKYYKPTEIGKKLVVVPSWQKYNNIDNRIEINLDPGMAFGTGTHETTALCMEYLEEYVKAGDSILDVGSGSGILGITGVLLGAKSSLGVDIDQMAVRVGIENAKINKVKSQSRFLQGDLTKEVKGRYNIVTANIVSDAIIKLSEEIKNYLIEGGIYITSGIIDERKDEVIMKVESLGFRMVSIKEKKGWVAILFMVE